jgi:hypothetical protein
MEETISLYLDLKPGEKADFEVVGLTAAAFAEAVKEIAFILDPSLEVRLEFKSGTEGSLSLNAILKTPEGRRGTVYGIILATSVMFISDARNWGVSKLLDYYFTKEERKQISDEDIDRIAKAVKGVDEGKIAKSQKQRIYKEIERDTAIEASAQLRSRTLVHLTQSLVPNSRVKRAQSRWSKHHLKSV